MDGAKGKDVEELARGKDPYGDWGCVGVCWLELKAEDSLPKAIEASEPTGLPGLPMEDSGPSHLSSYPS